MRSSLLALMTCATVIGTQPCAFASGTVDHGEAANAADTQVKVWQAEEWAKTRNSPWLSKDDAETDKKTHRGPVRNFVKAVAKGTAKELGASASDFAKDMVLVFSVQDIDPYEKKGPPKNRTAIVLKFTMLDGTSCFLRRFPDGSYAIEDGFADGTVLIPRQDTNDYLVKYPNNTRGRMVKHGDHVTIFRPDNTTTTVEKGMSGGFTVRNTKFGYMGEARPDSTGINYETGQW
ncbi:MAG: hypothetical protein IT342_01715 [Candidatus Melainabacteria bacterium]|nr:hypothetical protein [Candidatus Melainabacteria bacterium]